MQSLAEMNPRFEVMRDGAKANMEEWACLGENVTSSEPPSVGDATSPPPPPTNEADNDDVPAPEEVDNKEEEGTQV